MRSSHWIKTTDKSQQIRIVRSWAEFDLLRNQWQSLLEQSDANNIFLTWQWIDCWRRCQDTNIDLLMVVVEQSGKLLAVAPFYIAHYKLCGLIKYRALKCVADTETGAEYANFIVKSDNSEQFKKLLWQILLRPEVKKLWDIVSLHNISAWTAGGQNLLQSLAQVNQLKYHQRTIDFSQSPLPKYAKDVLPELSKSLRTNIHQTTRRLDRLGEWKIAMVTSDTELTRYLETLFTLHNMRWRHAGQQGSFERRPKLVDFYRKFVPLALAKGWLRLWYLELNGEIQAIQLGYVYKQKFLAIQEGYNPQALAGLGQVLRHRCFEQCSDEQLDHYDFLGICTAHKRRWLAEKRSGCKLIIWHNQAKNLPFKFAPIWPSGRYLNSI